MPTLKDISKYTGVSYGTVSNVINKRGNVSVEKIKLVENAAMQLGYYVNEKASALRSNKKTDVALIIPTLEDSKLRNTYSLLIKKMGNLGLKVNLYVTDFNPMAEEQYIKLSIATNKFIIVNTCMQKPEDFYQSVMHQGSLLIFIYSNFFLDLPHIYFIHYQSKQLMNDLNTYINHKNFKNILLFSDKDLLNHATDIVDQIDIRYCSRPYNLPTAIEILSEHDYELIIVSSIEKYESIMSAKKILLKEKQEEIILISDQDMSFDLKAHQYFFNTNYLVEVLNDIMESPNNFNTKRISLSYQGFLSSPQVHESNTHINLLMIESPSTSALLKIKPYIENKLGFTIHITTIKYNEYDLLLNPETIHHYDLIRVDMANLSECAEVLFKPLDHKFTKLIGNFIDNLTEYTHYNERIYALPFDIGCIVMMYRNDILNNQLIQREYYEQTKNSQIIPTNYKEYNRLESFFHKNYGDIFNPSTTCSGSSITCGNEMLLRVKSGDVLTVDGELNLHNPAVVAALDSYIKSISFTKNNHKFWDDVIKEYSDGNTIMSIVYSNYIHMLKTFNKEISFKTTYTFPPEKKSLIGGGVIGLSKHTHKEDLCYHFLEVLYSDQIGKILTHLGATMPIKAIYDDISLLSMYPWLELIPSVLKNNTRKHYAFGKLIQHTVEYEKAIGKKVKQFLAEQA